MPFLYFIYFGSVNFSSHEANKVYKYTFICLSLSLSRRIPRPRHSTRMIKAPWSLPVGLLRYIHPLIKLITQSVHEAV